MFLWNSPSKSGQASGQNFASIVSILVFVELALEEYRLIALERQRRVSILVFVELALEEAHGAPVRYHHEGFNPCFCGTRPRSAAIMSVRELSTAFQSLFLWNSPSKLDIPRPAVAEVCV